MGVSEWTWRRVCVDIDRACNVVGISCEWHDANTMQAVLVAGPAPFQTPAEAFEEAANLVPLDGEQLMSLYLE